MKIELYIENLLQKHDCVIVPNFGGFLVQPIPVVYHKNEKQFLPPSTEIRFNQKLKQNDDLLLSTIVVQEKISYNNAQEKINQYINEASQSLIDNKSFIINNVGRLYMDNNDNLRFQSDKQQNYNKNSYGLPKLTLNEIDRTKQEREKVVNKIQKNRKTSPLALVFMIVASIIAISLATLLIMVNHGTAQQQEYIQSGLGSLLNKKSYDTTTSITKQEQVNNNVQKEVLEQKQHKDRIEEKEEIKKDPIENTTPIASPSIEKPTNEKPFHVVLGLFKNEQSAKKILHNALNAGYKNAKIIHGKQYHRVVIPFYKTEISWIEAQNDVRKNVQPDAWVWETQYR